MIHAVPDLARNIAVQLDALFRQDALLARRLNEAHQRLQAANDRLWWGLHPDGLAALYGEDPGAVDIAFAEHRSEVLGAPDPLAAVQQVHWQIHSALNAYQSAAEERRQLAANIGELIQQLVDALALAGWSEQEARDANIQQLAGNQPGIPRRN